MTAGYEPTLAGLVKYVKAQAKKVRIELDRYARDSEKYGEHRIQSAQRVDLKWSSWARDLEALVVETLLTKEEEDHGGGDAQNG